MARQRIIRPEFFGDERLAACPPHGRLLFAGLWGLADKRGRLKDQPPVIHGAVFPFEPDVPIDALLDSLQEAGSILRYSVDGKNFIQIKNFERYQNPHPKETESTIPEVPLLYRAEPRKETAEPGRTSFLRSFVPSKPSKPSDAPPVRVSPDCGNVENPPAEEPEPERQELFGLCAALAERLGQDTAEVVARVAAIPAGNGHAGKSFSDPHAKGVSIEWVRAALWRAKELQLELNKPVPL